jgi:hypothetical protein
MPAAVAECFTFDDLDPKAKEHALERYRNWWVQDDWWSNVYEDAVHIAELLGISIDRKGKHGPAIHFSGFWSQGDGASFEGTYRPRADTYDALVAHIGDSDQTLHDLARRLTVLNVGWALDEEIGSVSATITTLGRYSHSGTMSLDVQVAAPDGQYMDCALVGEEELTACMREFANWIYKQLEAEHEYLTSDESLTEQFRDGETKFDEDGDII